MKPTAKARASRLVRKIERAIERGEFTPENMYLSTMSLNNVDIGPCGCARAAAQVVSGVDPYGVEYSSEIPGLTQWERWALEDGYEGEEYDPRSGSRAFFDAGRELRKFHPEAQS